MGADAADPAADAAAGRPPTGRPGAVQPSAADSAVTSLAGPLADTTVGAAAVDPAAIDPAAIAGTPLDRVDVGVTRRLPPGAPLRAHVGVFLGGLATRTMVAILVVLLVARAAFGDWSLLDLVVLAVLLAGYPFFEWFAHAVVLHSKPRTIAGRTRYLGVARNHRAHHLDPENPAKSLPDTTRNLAYLAIAVAVPTVVLLRDAGPRLTVGVFAITALLTYEWAHYLIHAAYKPRGRALKALRRRHLLHHHRDEKRWYGVASPLADVVLRTSPDPATVPVSPTCRTLGIDLPA